MVPENSENMDPLGCIEGNSDLESEASSHPNKIYATQAQARLEGWELEEKESANLASSVLSLQRFKNLAESPKKRKRVSKAEQSLPRKTDKVKAKPKKRVVEKKIKSITSHMTEKYNKNSKSISLSTKEIADSVKDKEEYVQISILKLLSGKKKKVSDILRRIESIEQDREEKEDEDEKEHAKDGLGEDKFPAAINEKGTVNGIVYNKADWINIIKSIKLTFPNLSARTKRSLANINKKMGDLVSEQDSNSLWSSASTPPSTKFTNEDMKWLYDLNDDEMMKSFNAEVSYVEENQPMVLTLSQIMRNETCRNNLESDQTKNLGPSMFELEKNEEAEKIEDVSSDSDDALQEIPNSSSVPSPIVIGTSDSEAENEVCIDDTYHNDKIDQISFCKEIESGNVDGGDEFSPKMPAFTNVSSHQRESLYDSNVMKPSQPFMTQYESESEVEDLIDDSIDDFGILESFKTSRISQNNKHSQLPGTQEQPIDLDSFSSDQANKSQIYPENRSGNKIQISESMFQDPSNQNESAPKSNEIVISSSADVFPTLKSVRSPNRKAPSQKGSQADTISPFKNPKRLDINRSSPLRSPFGSGIKNRTIIAPSVSSSQQSIYSTAKSEIYPSQNAPQSVRRKYKTSIVEVKGKITIASSSPAMYGTRISKVSNKRIVYDVDEIPDSDNSLDDDISLVEIIREIKDNKVTQNNDSYSHSSLPLPDNDRFFDFISSPVLQVPSSSCVNSAVNSPIKDSELSNKRKLVKDYPTTARQLTSTIVSENSLYGSKGHIIHDEESEEKDGANTFDDEKNEFIKLSTKDLKQKMIDWGLKPVRSRLKMIEVLTETNKVIDHEELELTQSQTFLQNDKDEPASQLQSQAVVRTNISNNITKIIENDRKWYEKILSYEPLVIEELNGFLNHNGINLESEMVKRYCDDLGICYTAKE